jgi:hypothetical protein
LVYALYAFLNKGIAYAFLAELLLGLGLVLMIVEFKQFVFIWNKPVKKMLLFILVTFIYALLAFGKFSVKAILQDSAMFIYAVFVFIMFMFQHEFDWLKEKLFSLYRWYPLGMVVLFLLVSFVPFFQTFSLFGNVPLLLYKYGDMAVHLLIATLLMLTNNIQLKQHWKWINACLIVFLFLVISSYNRAGMLAYLTGLSVFLLYYRKRFSASVVRQYTIIFIGVLVIVLSILANTKVEENFQGRTVGVIQLKKNVTSIFNNDVEGGLADNKLWRLAWWYTIINEATEPKNALLGKGIGENLALISDVRVEDESLRSPHNFHLNILARFGILFFGLWLVWMWDHLKQLKNDKLPELNVLILVFFIAFIVNASFDVYLEGPMGAMPFWTWLGILYVNDAKTIC